MNLEDAIRESVAAGRWRVTYHARQRLRQRAIPLWQIEAGLEHGKVVSVFPLDQPNPSVLVEQELADGAKVNVGWSYVILTDEALLVTAYLPD